MFKKSATPTGDALVEARTALLADFKARSAELSDAAAARRAVIGERLAELEREDALLGAVFDPIHD